MCAVALSQERQLLLGNHRFPPLNSKVEAIDTTPIPPISGGIDDRVANAMESVLGAKEKKVQAALDNKLRRYNPIFIGGDIFTVGYMAFEGIKCFLPSVASIAAIGIATLICGVVAGVINIGVGLSSLPEAIQAFKNGDTLKGTRLMIDTICCIGIGTIMILASLAIQVSALGGVGAFFAANPWLLPVLFLVAAVPLIIELGYHIKNIAMGADLGSQLKLDELQNHLEAENPDWEAIEELYAETPLSLSSLENLDDDQLIEELSKKMEIFQQELETNSAVETFNLLLQIKKRDKNVALEKMTHLKKLIGERNNSLYVRMFQQFLYFVGFGMSMGALSFKPDLLNGIQNFFLMFANLIPLYMDTFWPFKRNTPMIVEQVEKKDLV